ncbi:putative multidrug export ATP-binding/permease protein YgaD [Gammaproteobacteria bacterium]
MQTNFSSRYKYKSFIKENGLFASKNKVKSSDHKNNKSLRLIILRLSKELKEKRFQLVLIIGTGFIINMLAAAFPWTGKYFIDNIIPQKSSILLIASCAALMIIGIVDVGLNTLLDYKINIIGGNFSLFIKNRMMRHLQKLPLIRIQELKVGGVISRLQEDTDTMSGLLFEIIVSPLNAFTMLIIAFASLFLISWKVSIVCVVFSFFVGVVSYFIFNIMQPVQKSLREDNSIIVMQLSEVFSGTTAVRSFCKELSVRRKYGNNIGLLWRKSLYGNVVDIFVNRTLLLIYYCTEIFIWLFGGYSVISGKMTVGEVVVFISFVPYVFNPVFNIIASFSKLQKSLACADRVFGLLDEKIDTVDDNKNAITINKIKDGIKFNNVTFCYPDSTRALENISIKIPKGKVTAIVGPSGSGKTTLINLILRFYKVTDGKITIDDININELNLRSYRKMLGLVLQEPFMFDGTVKENISYGNSKAQQDEIERVAKVANCHEFIQKLKYGYDANIGERGVKLSGGQKQRIALARALLPNPQILILDEATVIVRATTAYSNVSI